MVDWTVEISIDIEHCVPNVEMGNGPGGIVWVGKNRIVSLMGGRV